MAGPSLTMLDLTLGGQPKPLLRTFVGFLFWHGCGRLFWGTQTLTSSRLRSSKVRLLLAGEFSPFPEPEASARGELMYHRKLACRLRFGFRSRRKRNSKPRHCTLEVSEVQPAYQARWLLQSALGKPQILEKLAALRKGESEIGSDLHQGHLASIRSRVIRMAVEIPVSRAAGGWPPRRAALGRP